MSWFTQFFLHPAEKAVAAAPAASEATASAAASVTQAVSSSIGAATSAVDPLIDELVAGAQALLDGYLHKVNGGQVITPAANLALSLGAAAAKAALDQRLLALIAPPPRAAA